ncbi:50S ribosomal protein L10, partial [Xanthomonas oryzae pv. oryzae]
MALNLSQKQEVVAELADVAAKAHSLIAAEYAGTTVSQMTAMRKQARETGVFLKVVKNTLAARAVEGTDFAVAADKLVGPLLYAFSMEEPGAAGRLIKEFAKSNDKLQAKVV